MARFEIQRGATLDLPGAMGIDGEPRRRRRGCQRQAISEVATIRRPPLVTRNEPGGASVTLIGRDGTGARPPDANRLRRKAAQEREGPAEAGPSSHPRSGTSVTSGKRQGSDSGRLDHPLDSTGSDADAKAIPVLTRAERRQDQDSQSGAVDEADLGEVEDWRPGVVLEFLPKPLLKQRSGGDVEFAHRPDGPQVTLLVAADNKPLFMRRTRTFPRAAANPHG